MYNNERVILFDENGSPYIAHAGLFGKSSVKKDTKYVDKIKDNKGKTRYFYTQEEIKAYYDNLKGKASNASQNAGNAIRNAVRNASGANDKAYAEYSHRKMREQQRQMNSDKRAELDARQAANRSNAIATAREAFGKDASAQRDNADRALKVAENARQDYESHKYAADVHKGEYKLAMERYANSPLGKLESTLNNAKSAYNKAQGTLKQAASDTMNKVHEATGLAARDRRDAARTNYIEKAAKAEAAAEEYGNSSEYKKISDANDRRTRAYVHEIEARNDESKKRAQASRAKAKFDLDRALNNASDSINAWNEAERESSRAKKEYDNAKKAYENSPAGRVENAVNVTKAEYNKLQNKLREVGELSQAEMQKLFAYIQDNYSKK